jgi:hypothetical protein
MADTPAEDLKAALHSALANGKYHSDREAHLDFWDRAITFGVLLTGGVAFFELFGEKYQKFGGAVLGLFALAQLVFNLSINARNHQILKKKYFEISASLENGSICPKEARSKMLLLAGEEPPPYCAVLAIAEHWADEILSSEKDVPPCGLGFLPRITRHWLRHEGLSNRKPKISSLEVS